jgi:sugar transferase EpsL
MQPLDRESEMIATWRRPVHRCFKRILDIAGSLVGIAIVSPILLAVSVAVYATMGRPILFRQIRAGYNEKPFRLLKFRTMRNDRDHSGSLLPDFSRLTKLGRFLRSWSLDELPQLWNVFRGELSLVGPRPLPMRYLPRYTPRQRMRHRVSPGMTGLAQISGRNDLDWESRLQLDMQYCERFSLWLDLAILAATLRAVCLRTGAGDQAPSVEFWGALGNRGNSLASYPLDENEWT